MTDEKEILEMLRAGKSIQEIGDNFANILNAAKAQFDQEEAKKSAHKINWLTDIIANLLDWINEYVTEVHENPEALAKEVIAIIDSSKGLKNWYMNLFDFEDLNKYLDKFNKDQKEKECAAKQSKEDSLQSFVDMFLKQ